MRGSIRITLLGSLATCVLGILVGQASAATIEAPAKPFVAIYSFPAATTENAVKEMAIGGGLGRNFGFGENMFFQAGNGVGEPIEITVGKLPWEAGETFMGGTIMSNKTGLDNPLSFTVQFVDWQKSMLNGELTPTYSDTSDRPWITEICPPGDVKCRVDPLFEVGAAGPTVKIEDASFNIGAPGPPTVVQGTIWGKWENGKKEVAPCISFVLPPEKAGPDQTLIVTQSIKFPVGTRIEAIKGKACLISANNDWYPVSPPNRSEIIIKNP